MLLPTIMSFKTDCQHVFVAVEQEEIIVGVGYSDIGYVGKHEGGDIICVKCFHQKKQIVNYSQLAPSGTSVSGGDSLATMLGNFNNIWFKPIHLDTLGFDTRLIFQIDKGDKK